MTKKERLAEEARWASLNKKEKAAEIAVEVAVEVASQGISYILGQIWKEVRGKKT